ncbi:MAG: hypothetical protein RIC19_07425 [Phaeodactylibacter sp.]|uniref:hypothetical protein n=1 Tax=Phaeodactylibacter sp. TaxID=1940289 RepID=UPI0032ED2151
MKKSIAIAAALLPLTLLAHGGHGVGQGNQFFHYLASPDHFIPMALASVAVIGFFVYRKAQRKHS